MSLHEIKLTRYESGGEWWRAEIGEVTADRPDRNAALGAILHSLIRRRQLLTLDGKELGLVDAAGMQLVSTESDSDDIVEIHKGRIVIKVAPTGKFKDWYRAVTDIGAGDKLFRESGCGESGYSAIRDIIYRLTEYHLEAFMGLKQIGFEHFESIEQAPEGSFKTGIRCGVSSSPSKPSEEEDIADCEVMHVYVYPVGDPQIKGTYKFVAAGDLEDLEEGVIERVTGSGSDDIHARSDFLGRLNALHKCAVHRLRAMVFHDCEPPVMGPEKRAEEAMSQRVLKSLLARGQPAQPTKSEEQVDLSKTIHLYVFENKMNSCTGIGHVWDANQTRHVFRVTGDSERNVRSKLFGQLEMGYPTQFHAADNIQVHHHLPGEGYLETYPIPDPSPPAVIVKANLHPAAQTTIPAVQSASCGNCHFAHKLVGGPRAGSLICQRNPPQITFVRDPALEKAFPIVEPEWYCGEHKFAN